MKNFYRIAGLTVAMDSFGTARAQAEPYRCEPVEQPDIIVQSRWPLFKEKYADTSDDIGEYLFSGGNFYKQLLDFGGMMLHSSAVVKDGKTYLFSADCGTGKSTHTQLWLREFPDAFILNDDKPALRREDDGWFAYGTPWSGKTDQNVNQRVPLAGIAILERAEENAIAPYRGIAATRALLKQVNRPRAAEYRIKLMDLLDKLITEVPIWKLSCNMEPEAAHLSFETMSKGQTK